MSILETKKIEPATGTTVTLGAAGETVAISASQLKTNTIKDAGGNTILTSDGSGTLSSVNSAMSSTMVFISSQTADASSSIEFTSGIDSTYDEYVFYFVNINPATDNTKFQFNLSIDGGSNYNVTKTTTFFRAQHRENGTGGTVDYNAGDDLAQGTGYQPLTETQGNGSDECAGGILYLYEPSSTTYVKQFHSRVQFNHGSDYSEDAYAAGYGNTTSAVNAISFNMASGNFDGTIKMYGIT